MPTSKYALLLLSLIALAACVSVVSGCTISFDEARRVQIRSNEPELALDGDVLTLRLFLSLHSLSSNWQILAAFDDSGEIRYFQTLDTGLEPDSTTILVSGDSSLVLIYHFRRHILRDDSVLVPLQWRLADARIKKQDWPL